MSASPPRDVEMAESSAPSPSAATSAEPQPTAADKVDVAGTVGDAGDDDDDLFGGDDGGGGDGANGAADAGSNDGEEDEDDIRPSARRRQRVVGSGSPDASPQKKRTTSGSGLPTFDDDEAIEDDANLSASGDEAEAARLAALEYTEEGHPMGERGARSPSPAAATRVTTVSLPNTAQRFTPSHLARLPHFLKLESRHFDEDAYKAERREAIERERAQGDTDEKMQDVERRLRCENTVRWKLGENGQRMSNARFVRWSDGSWTLQVGKEQFDINGLDTRHAPNRNVDASNGAEPSQSQGQSQSQSQSQQPSQQPKVGSSTRPPGNTQPLNYLASPDFETGVFQTLSPLYSNISIQPTSTHSATHRLISKNLSSLRARQAAAKVAKSELVVGEKAPEELKREREKKLLDEERKKRLRKKKERGGDIEDEEEAELSGLLRGRRRTLIDSVAKGSKGKAGAGLGGKRGLGRGNAGLDDYEEDEGGYMEEDAEGFIVDDENDDAEGEDDDDDDDDEEGGATKKKKSKARRSGGDMDVDSDEDEGGEEELDAMEQAELRIEKQEAARARAKKEAAQGGEGEDGNEAASQQRKKKVVIDSDEDE